MSADRPAACIAEPLNVRLRAEAAEWDEGESIVPLLVEAAEAVEMLACKVAIQEANRV